MFGALAALAWSDDARGALSPRGLHVVPLGDFLPYTMVLAPDGTAWLGGSWTQGLARVTADGQVIRYRLPVKSPILTMAWGADGALWAVDDDVGGVIRVTPDGHFTRYRNVWRARNASRGGPGSAEPDVLSPDMIAAPDGTVWLGDREHHRISSVASDGSVRVVARLDRSVDPELLGVGTDGSVWLSDSANWANDYRDPHGGLTRILPNGRVEPFRYRRSHILDGTVAPNGDVWFIRETERTDVVRIDPRGNVTSFPSPFKDFATIAVGPDGTIWLLNGDGILARIDPAGHVVKVRHDKRFVQLFRVAPDGRLWLSFGDPWRLAWLPPNPCLSQRRATLRLRSQARDPIRAVTVAVPSQRRRIFHGRKVRIPVDLRGYLPGAVHVTVRVRTAHRRYTRRHVFHTCATSD